MRRFSSHESGSYVLEFAVVILGAVVFVAGASDIARIFQARSAVRAAVQEGARCLYPTDADCAAASPEVLSSPSRTFNVWVWGSGYQIERESYVASARWQQEPILEVPIQRDEVVGGTVEQRQFQYRPHTVLYPVTAHTPYFMQTRHLPVVVGGSPLNPHFADPFTRRIAHPNATHSLGAIAGSTTQRARGSITSEFHPRLRIGSVSFAVSDAWPTAGQDGQRLAALPAEARNALPCYASPMTGGMVLDWSAPRHECRYRSTDVNSSVVMASGALRVPLLFRVAGSTRGTSEQGEGKVTIAMSWTSPSGGNGHRELGGRVFGHLRSGDFVPRGLATSDIERSLRGDYADYGRELKAYFELPLLPIDATVTLEFFLMSENGRPVQWRGEVLELWYPQYRFVHERHDCGYSPSATTCVSPRGDAPSLFLSVSEGAEFRAVADGADVCSFVENPRVERDSQVVLRRLEEAARNGITPEPHSFQLVVETDQSVCPSRTAPLRCGRPSQEYLKGCGGSFADGDIAGWCDIESPPGALIHIKDLMLETSIVTTKRVRACSEAALPECARPHAREVGATRYYGDAGCTAARTVMPAPLIVGPLYTNSCESRDASIQDAYRREQAVPLDVPIAVVRLPATPVFSATPPSHSCVPYSPAEGSERELLCGEGLSASAAERCCKESSYRCRKLEVLHASSPRSENGRDSILTRARQRVIDTVQVAYPPARHQATCATSERDCLEVSAALDRDDTVAVVSAKMQVPLHILDLFDGEIATVQHASTRALERVALR